MLRDIPYKKLESFIQASANLNAAQKKDFSDCFEALPPETCPSANGVVCPSLAALIDQYPVLKELVPQNETNAVPHYFFCGLYVSVMLRDSIVNLNDFVSVEKVAVESNLYKRFNPLHEKIVFAALALKLVCGQTEWKDFYKNVPFKNWYKIHLLAAVLPYSRVNYAQMNDWLMTILLEKEKDHGIGGLSIFLYEWLVFNPGHNAEVEEDLLALAEDRKRGRFLASLLKGLQHNQQNNVGYYAAKFQDHIRVDNAFDIFFALGSITEPDSQETDLYFALLLDKLDSGNLCLKDFVLLCNYAKLLRQELMDRIAAVLKDTGDVQLLSAIIDLVLCDEKSGFDKEWTDGTLKLLMSKAIPEITDQLSMLLINIADKDLTLAYDLFEFRMRIMAGMEFLQDALEHMIVKDVFLFQRRLIRWFIADDQYLHLGARYVCASGHIDKNIFSIPPNAFDGISNGDRLFMGYKIVGYVYSMEALQRLMISLIRSVLEPDPVLEEGFRFFMSAYVIYNYRTTLELLRAELKDNTSLSVFAGDLFKKLIEEYETYFAQLRELVIDKELRPSKEHILHRSFSMRKHYADIPKSVEKNSIMNYFKNVQLNCNRWAVLRPGQPRHEAGDLGHFTFSTEFPSGENLNPIYQEQMRKTYQKVRRHEIDFN